MPIPPSVANRPGALLAIAARTGQELARHRLAPLGLTVQLCGVLIRLAEGPLSQHELGQQLGIDRTTVVELIDELERKGYVERRRNPSDRRSYLLTLTARGRTFQKRAAQAFDAAAADVFAPLEASEVATISDMLRRMILNADRQLKESSL